MDTTSYRGYFSKTQSLGGLQQEEAKNTGQINLQPNDVEASMTRE